MRIITAAIPGTGDLWLFNATRLICEQNGLVYGVESKHYHAYEAKNYDFSVIKATTYELDFITNSVVVSTSCDPSEIVFSEAKPNLVGLYYDMSRWNAHANGVIEYEQIKNNPLKAVKRLSYALNLHCDPVLIKNQLNEIKAPDKGRDNKTLLTVNATL